MSPAAADAVVVVGKGRRTALADLADLWRYRELVATLAARDVKVRYKQTVFGVLWVLLQPGLSALLFIAIFGRLAKLPSDGVPYELFVVTGLVPWLFVATSVTNASGSIIAASSLIGKVYFPRLVVPVAATAAAVVDLAIALPLALVVIAVIGAPIGPAALLAPLFCVGLLVAAASVGTLLCALTVMYRDFRYAVPFGVQLWMYATPVVYPVSMLPERWRPFAFLNPATGFIEGFRASLCGLPIPWAGVLTSTIATVAILAAALLTFAGVERRLVDRL